MTALRTFPWVRRALLSVFLLAVLAPVFGWAAGAVGYAEPLENAAEATSATDAAVTTAPGPLQDYSVPGVATPVGTLLSALVGIALTFAVAVGTGRLLEQ